MRKRTIVTLRVGACGWLIMVGMVLLVGRDTALHATPPKLEGDELKKWNDGADVGDNNCYNYGTNNKNNKYAQPGWTNVAQRQFVNGKAGGTKDGARMTSADYCKDVIARAKKDGLTAVGVVADAAIQGDPILDPQAAEPTVQDQPNLVALVVHRAPVVGNGDYHWYRRDQNGKWSHKPGGFPARTQQGLALAPAGADVTDPRDPAQTGRYEKFCAYMSVSKPAPNLDGLIALGDIPDGGVRCVRLIHSGIGDPFTDFVGLDVDTIVSLVASIQSESNEVSPPGWTVPSADAVFDLVASDSVSGQLPPRVRVSAGVVAVYSDDVETGATFYRDIDGRLGAFLSGTHSAPTISVWGCVVLVPVLLGCIAMRFGRRRPCGGV